MTDDILSREEYVEALAREAMEVVIPSGAIGSDGTIGLTETESPIPELLKSWEFRTLADAYEPRPPLEYVIPGIIALGTLSVVFGAPGSLKSMLLADMAVCIAAGLPWLPPLESVD